MREFYSEKEKEILNYLVDNYNHRIGSDKLVIRFANVVALEIFAEECSYQIIIKDAGCQKNNEEQLAVAVGSIVELMILLEGLVKDSLIKMVDTKSLKKEPVHRLFDTEKYMYFEGESSQLQADDACNRIDLSGEYQSKITLENGRIGNGIFKYMVIKPNNPFLYEDICSLIYKIIYISPQLRELKDNGYKTPTQRRFEEEQKSTKRSIRIALIVGVCSILLGAGSIIISLFINTRINNQQLKSLLYSIESTSPLQRVDARVINDTLNVNVINEKLISGNPEKKERP